MSLTFEQFRKVNTERAMLWHKGDLFSWDYADWFTALAGEVGELGNTFKKLKRLEDEIPSARDKDLTPHELKNKIADEIGDIQTYLDLVATRCGLTLEHCLISKFNLVSEREGFPQQLKLFGDQTNEPTD